MRAWYFYASLLYIGMSFPLAGQAQFIVEAENGILTGTTVATSHVGYSGTGYVTGFDTVGDKLTVIVNVPAAGIHALILRYATPYGEKTNDIWVNGSFLKAQVFPPVNTFEPIEVALVALNAGDNTVEVRHNWGWFEVDNITLIPESQFNQKPVADGGGDYVKMDFDGNGKEDFLLDASSSFDPDGTITAYVWKDKAGNILGTGAQIAIKNVEESAEGYEVVLEVTDDEGGKGQTTLRLFTGDASRKERLKIRNGTVSVFASGVNLAWNKFAFDLTDFDEAYFILVLDSLKKAGGNALRWWLHTNGRYSPSFAADGTVNGPGAGDIGNMKKALDLAYERDIMISMCLWSFDMLQPQGQDQQRMKALIENKSITQTYIDNALFPILEAVGEHPAVMTWEVFNEPEGMTEEFGWTPVRTTMAYVQQFINRVAGAIHRKAPGALVSNGSWSFRASTEKSGYQNYYSDEKLITAGGDLDGTLDFYQVHYYPTHSGNTLSPFHRPASHWGLDKPIVIGEFPIDGLEALANPHLSTDQAYQRAFEYGYAGVLSWAFNDANVGIFPQAVDGLTYLRENYPQEVDLIAEAVTSLTNSVEDAIFVSPNPADLYIAVKTPTPVDYFHIYDLQGRRILAEENVEPEDRIDISFMGKGLYIVKMQRREATVIRKLVVR